MIKKIKGLYYVFNHTGRKRLSKGYKTKPESQKRLREIEYFKSRVA